MESYRDLRVWQQGVELAVFCYEITKPFPKEELFGMTSQIRRCASSVPANIAEGWGRQSTGDYIKFLRVAQGSLKELETHVEICTRIRLLTNDQSIDLERQTNSIGKMLAALIRSLQKKTP